MDREWVKQLISNFSVATINELDVSGLLADKQRYTPSRLFKIRTCSDFALENLRNRTLYLSVANDFNDPYDTAFWVDYKILAVEEKLIELKFSPEKTNGVLNASNPLDAFLALASTEQPSDFNSGEWLEAVEAATGQFQTQPLHWLIDQLKSSYKICSLSERIDSVLMWSHYGLNHTGFAMEYDFSRLHRNDVSTLSLWPVTYTNTLFDITHIIRAQRRNESFNNLFGVPAALCKATDWQYEREWRLVIPDDKEKRGLSLKAPLKAVHLGARISEEDEARIKEICNSLKIPVLKVRLAPHEYRMISEPLGEETPDA